MARSRPRPVERHGGSRWFMQVNFTGDATTTNARPDSIHDASTASAIRARSERGLPRCSDYQFACRRAGHRLHRAPRHSRCPPPRGCRRDRRAPERATRIDRGGGHPPLGRRSAASSSLHGRRRTRVRAGNGHPPFGRRRRCAAARDPRLLWRRGRRRCGEPDHAPRAGTASPRRMARRGWYARHPAR